MGAVVACLLRFAAIIFGYIAASLGASAFIHVIFFATAGFQASEMPALAAGSFVFSVPFVALFVAYFAFMPALVVILVSELFSRRDWLFYALGGGVVAGVFLALVHRMSDPDFDVTETGAMLAVIGGGMVGGIFYWLVAGRHAGSWRATPMPRPPISPAPSGS